VKSLDAARAQIDTANSAPGVLGAAWDAFELTRLVARAYANRVAYAFAMWTPVIPPACDGRDALGFAPSTSPGPGLVHDLSDLGSTSEDQAADDLADLAVTVAAKLLAISAETVTARDTDAIARAVGCAEELRGLLSQDG
jgi:hypothetical protein